MLQTSVCMPDHPGSREGWLCVLTASSVGPASGGCSVSRVEVAASQRRVVRMARAGTASERCRRRRSGCQTSRCGLSVASRHRARKRGIQPEVVSQIPVREAQSTSRPNLDREALQAHATREPCRLHGTIALGNVARCSVGCCHLTSPAEPGRTRPPTLPHPATIPPHPSITLRTTTNAEPPWNSSPSSCSRCSALRPSSNVTARDATERAANGARRQVISSSSR
jgi:hypothetical protein